VRWHEKCTEESKAGVNQYLCHGTELCEWNSSPLIWTREAHLGEGLWLGVLQCISSVLGTEKQMPRRDALASSFSELLETADIAIVGEGGDCESKVVHKRDHQGSRDPEVERGHIEEEEEP